jgi:hypothetical protein
MLFNVMISRFFTKKQRERENRGKKAGKRETATTLIWSKVMLSEHAVLI